MPQSKRRAKMQDQTPSPAGRVQEVEEEEEEEEEGVSDNPLPAWMEGDSLAPPCQADMDVVRAIIDFAGVTEDDVLYDLGCGDGRICIEAAESRGAKACGVEIEEDLADKFRRRVAARGLESKVSVIHGDLRDLDLSDATVVVMYLLPEAMADIAQSHLLPLLRRGRPQQPQQPRPQEGTPSADPPPLLTPPSMSGDSETHDGDAFDDRGVHRSTCEDRISSREEAGVVAGEETGGGELFGGRGDGANGRSCIGSSMGGGGDDAWVGGGSDKRLRPCRIVCNTWGIPGATAVREAGVGLHGGVKLRLFTDASLAGEGHEDSNI